MDRVLEKVTSNSTVDGGRRGSIDSSSHKLTKILSGKSRRSRKEAKNEVGDGVDGPTASLYSSSTAHSDEGPLATEDSGNFTEDSESEV
jgi:hypothetical protein